LAAGSCFPESALLTLNNRASSRTISDSEDAEALKERNRAAAHRSREKKKVAGAATMRLVREEGIRRNKSHVVSFGFLIICVSLLSQS
jgi:hypothetical protein